MQGFFVGLCGFGVQIRFNEDLSLSDWISGRDWVAPTIAKSTCIFYRRCISFCCLFPYINTPTTICVASVEITEP